MLRINNNWSYLMDKKSNKNEIKKFLENHFKKFEQLYYEDE